jgi:transposase InsO family protein
VTATLPAPTSAAATVIDMASRRVVGYAMADHLRTELVSDALSNAVAARDQGPGVIFHSDCGCHCQYTSAAYAALAEDDKLTLYVGRTGQRWDNALAESFLSSLKGELIDTAPGPPGSGPDVRWLSTSPGTTGPAALIPRLPKPSQLRKQPPRKRQASSLTTHQPCPSKRGNLSGGL